MLFTSLLIALGSALVTSAQEYSPDYSNPLEAKVLLFTFTEGFRHDSIPTSIKQLQAWGPYYNISFDATEDQDVFIEENLAKYDALMFVHTTGNLFTTAGQAAFADYLNKGGNFAAIHAASVAYMPRAWAPWTETLGATFSHHPRRQQATFIKEATNHPATNPTPDQWRFEEEVYSFTTDPRRLGAKLLYSVDRSSYTGDHEVPEQGTPHPIAWYQEYAAGARIRSGGSGPGVAGRSFYSSLGHMNETWMDATFMKHVMGGLSWTLASNTTRVAQGLYNGADPTVHTGATNNATSSTINPWAPVLGSSQVAANPPPRPSTTAPAGSPEATGGATTSSSSGALIGATPTAFLAVAAAALGAVFGSVL